MLSLELCDLIFAVCHNNGRFFKYAANTEEYFCAVCIFSDFLRHGVANTVAVNKLYAIFAVFLAGKHIFCGCLTCSLAFSRYKVYQVVNMHNIAAGKNTAARGFHIFINNGAV